MRSLPRALAAVALVLILPAPSLASGFEITVEEPLGIDFGPAGASFSPARFDKIFIDGVFQETPWLSGFSGEVEFTAGPLLSLTVDVGEATSRYVYGPGTFTLTANWSDQFGNPLQGHYVAPLLELVIDIRCEQELSVNDCGDASGEHGSLGDAFVSVGPGEFDGGLASTLHVHKQGGAFDFAIALDGITGNPSDDLRISGSQSGNEEIDIPVGVPEPSILSLLLLAPVVRRRFRR